MAGVRKTANREAFDHWRLRPTDAELRALADTDIFALAQTEQRTVVTENIPDFSDIADGYDQRGQVHYGLVLADPSRYPRGSPATIGVWSPSSTGY